MNKRSRFYGIILVFLITALLLPAGLLSAQGSVFEVVIPQGQVDTSHFPSVSVHAIVSNDARSRVTGLSDANFVLREDGQEMPFTLSQTQVGIQVVFVLDASLGTRQNGATGYTRLEEGKQIVYSFAENQMAEGVDQVAVLAPASATEIQKVAPLPDDPADFTTFKNTLRDGTYLYELPQGVTNTPLSDLVSSALAMLEGSDTTMHQAVVVISDGIDTISDREVADIVVLANQQNVPIYTVIFGPQNNWGGQAESNMKRFSLETHGEHFQLSSDQRKPEPIDTLINQSMTDLYASLTSQRDQYVLTYNSAIFSPGSHEVAISAGGKSTKTGFSLNVRPPQVTILQPISALEIVRSTDDPDLTAEEIEPRTQLVEFEVSWPDGYPRDLASVELLVDGVAVPDACTPPCSQITWNLTRLGDGSHSIRLRVKDQQGLQAESGEVPLTIRIVKPTPVPPPTATPMPTPTPIPIAPTCEEQYTGVSRLLRCNTDLLSLAALVVSLLALIVVVILLRRKPKVLTSVKGLVKGMTEPFFPDRGKVRPAGDAKAELVILEGDDPSRKPIDLVGDNIRMGRDEALAQVVLTDRSVSRLHARIGVEPDRRGGERYTLFDEGSTSGTYVNYEPVGINGQPLKHNDIINLGRVRMQFKLKVTTPAGAAIDETIPMQPVFPGKAKPEDATDTVVAGDRSATYSPPPAPEPPKDAFATEPYEPMEPGPGPGPAPFDATQPIISRQPRPATPPPPAAPPPPPPIDQEDLGDDVSTQPYVPMDFD